MGGPLVLVVAVLVLALIFPSGMEVAVQGQVASPDDQAFTLDAVAPWAKTYNGPGADSARSVQPTADGGYIVAGSTDSFGTGNIDWWLLRLNALGGVVWEHTYGGPGTDYAWSVVEVSGGFVAAGYRSSGAAQDQSLRDAWVLKLGTDGAILWQRAYGGADRDEAHAIATTADGGYIVAGEFTSGSSPKSNRDVWVLKLNGDGGVAWQKTYGGKFGDSGYSVQQTADGGYVVAGILGAGAKIGLWVLKLNGNGGVVWQRTHREAVGGSYPTIQQTTDGGYVISSTTNSFGAGLYDAWVLKLDANGDIVWQKTYGGPSYDQGRSIRQTADGGYIVAGTTQSFGAGSSDVWLLRLDGSGGITWQKTYGGADGDYTYGSVAEIASGGFVVSAMTHSFILPGELMDAIWILSVDANGSLFNCVPPGMGASSSATVMTTTSSGTATQATLATPTVAVTTTDSAPGTSQATVDTQCG